MLFKEGRSLQRAFVISFLFNMVTSVLNYAFTIILGNMLTIEDFGVYNTINSLAANIVIFFSPLSIIICQITAANCNELQRNAQKYKQIMIISIMIMVMINVIGILAYPWLEGRIGVNSIFTWEVILLMIGVSGLYTVLYSIIQGLSKFVAYGMVGNILVLTKLVISIINISAGVEGIIFAMLFSYMLLTGIVCALLKKYIVVGGLKDAERFGKREIFELYGMTFLVSLFYSFYINGGEIIFMGFLFDDKQVGLYSAASALGKISLYVIAVITVVLFPTVASRKGQGLHTRTMLFKMAAGGFIFSAIYSVFLISVGKNIIPLLFGEKYRPALEYVHAIIIFIIPLNVLSIVHTYFLGIGRLKEYTFILGSITIVAIGIIVAAIDSISYVPIVLGIALYVIIILSMIYVYRMRT